MKEIVWFIVFWAAGLALFILFLSGHFSGKRFSVGAALLGLLLAADLIRANTPWVSYYDYREKYASNPVIDLLKENPQEHRVATKFNPFGGPYFVLTQDQIGQIYSALCNEWLQHHFQFYRIHSLDVVQMSRMPELDSAFIQGFQQKGANASQMYGRLWQLTNTRYLLGEKALFDVVKQQMGAPLGGTLTVLTNFDIVPKRQDLQVFRLEDFTAQLNPNGRFSLVEFGGALPRAALFGNWEANADPESTLQRLTSTNFNPLATALVDAGPSQSSASTTNAGSAKIERYGPTRVEISAEVKAPALLVLFDKYDPLWKVTVDGKPATIARADFIFRGVFLEPGTHKVTFEFRTPMSALYVSLGAIATALLLCLYVGLRGERMSGNVAVGPSD